MYPGSRLLAVVHVLLGLLFALPGFVFRIQCRFQSMDGLSQTFFWRSDHLRLQLVERNAEVVRDMYGGHELAQVLESLGSCLQVGPRRKQACELAGESGVV